MISSEYSLVDPNARGIDEPGNEDETSVRQNVVHTDQNETLTKPTRSVLPLFWVYIGNKLVHDLEFSY